MKTVNLELSRQLKEAGYPQENVFYWYSAGKTFCVNTPDRIGAWSPKGINVEFPVRSIASAPTADEILDLLPEEITIDKTGEEEFDKWQVECGDWAESDNNLANAAAQMWLYLKKEGLL